MSELSRSSLNAGFNDEIQFRLLAVLIPAIEKGLEQAWGAGWFDRLNERRAERSDPKNSGRPPVTLTPIKLVEGRPNWDTNTVLHTIRRHVRDLPNLRSDRIDSVRTWCTELLDLRNASSHFDKDNYHKVNTDRKLGYQASLAINLLRAFSAHDAAKEIEELMDGPWASMRGDQSRSSDEPTAPPPQPTNPTDEPDNALLNEDFPELAPSDPKPRRRMPLPPPTAGVAVFPLAGQGNKMQEDECLAAAAGTVLGPMTDRHFALATILTGNEDVFYQVIKDVRHSEPDGPKLSMKTRVRFDAAFMGDSFGLAAAIADRSVRYGLASRWADRRIVATGVVLPRRGGDVGPVDALAEKINIVRAFIPSGSLFIIPKDNLERADPNTKARLAALDAQGIAWRAVSHVNDLNDLLESYGEASSAEAGKAPGAASSPSPVELPTSSREAPLPVARAAFWVVGRRQIAAGVITVFVAFSILYALATWRDQQSQDIVAIQASDERLLALTNAASGTDFGTPDRAECRRLSDAAAAISAFDKSRFDDTHRRAIVEAQTCVTLAKESGMRLDNLLAAAKAAQSQRVVDIIRLANSRAALNSFDTDDVQTDDIRLAITDGDRAVEAVRASDARIGEFGRTLVDWKSDTSNGAKAQTAADSYKSLQMFDLDRPDSSLTDKIGAAKELTSSLAASDTRINQAIVAASTFAAGGVGQNGSADQAKLDLLTSFDESRLSDAQRSIIDRARSEPRKARWANFEAAAIDYRNNAGPANTSKLATSFEALTNADRVALAPQLGAYRDMISVVQRSIIESDARLSAFAEDFDAVNFAERKKTELAAPYQRLADDAARLTDLDRQRLGPVHQDALDKATEVGIEIANSDKRLQSLQTWSDVILQAKVNGAVPRQLMDKMRDARAALTALDKARITPELKRAVEKVCSVPVETSPRMLPAIPGSECYDTGVFKPKMLPAIR